MKEELEPSTVAKFATVQNEGGRAVTREIEYYNLDMIISVGYRVKSKRGVEFRRWANNARIFIGFQEQYFMGELYTLCDLKIL